MKELIEALQIFLKYKDVKSPFHCEHDKLHVCGYSAEDMSVEDYATLERLGFHWDSEDGIFYSYRWGSC